MDTLDFLSDSSSGSSNSESDNEENIAAEHLQAAFQEKIAQKANASIAYEEVHDAAKTTDTATNFTSIVPAPTNNIPNASLPPSKLQKVKKRPPAPNDFSKMLGITINEAPKSKIKKLSDSHSDRIEKRAKELEDKYSWCFEDNSTPVHQAVQNPYDIDDMDCHEASATPATTDALEETTESQPEKNESRSSLSKSLRISRMVAADWASSVAPPSEDLFSEAIETREASHHSNSYEEFNKKKNGYSHRERASSKHRHRPDKKSSYQHQQNQQHHHDKRHSRDYVQQKTTAVQCPSPSHSLCLSVHASTQTMDAPHSSPSSSQTASESEKLNKPDFYKGKADDMKKILALMSDPVSTLIVRLKLSLLEVQQVVAMMAYRCEPNVICHHINPVILACRKNLEELKKFKEINIVLKDALTVINMKLMSFLYHQIYIVKRDELAKAKLVLDNFIMFWKLPGSGLAHPGSAIEAAKRTEGKEMAGRELSSMKMYLMHMEYFAKSFNYVERANLVIKNHPSDFFARHNFRELHPINSIFRHVTTISSALIEANRIHDDEAP